MTAIQETYYPSADDYNSDLTQTMIYANIYYLLILLVTIIVLCHFAYVIVI